MAEKWEDLKWREWAMPAWFYIGILVLATDGFLFLAVLLGIMGWLPLLSGFNNLAFWFFYSMWAVFVLVGEYFIFTLFFIYAKPLFLIIKMTAQHWRLLKNESTRSTLKSKIMLLLYHKNPELFIGCETRHAQAEAMRRYAAMEAARNATPERERQTPVAMR